MEIKLPEVSEETADAYIKVLDALIANFELKLSKLETRSFWKKF